MNWHSQRGAGRVGCLLSLMALLLFGYVCFMIIPVYIDKMDFEEEVSRLAGRAGSVRMPDEKIHSDLLNMARYKKFEIAEKDIKIERSSRIGGEIRISAKYAVPVEFPGYKHVFHFEARASSIVGSLR